MANDNEHDCEKCDRVKSQIEITRSEKEKGYDGVMHLKDASFGYSLKFTGDISQIKNPADMEKHVQFTITDADGKNMSLDQDMTKYFMMVVATAAARFELESQMTRAVAGGLEQMFGAKVEIPTSGNYEGCIPANEDVKKYLQEYKARGQKA